MAKLYSPEEWVLSNGMPVILQHLEGEVGALYWWNQVGSADEKRGEEGFAHFLEHMLFKDAAAKETGIASSGQTARAIESLGGDINAYTSFDQTVYHVTCAESHWEKVMDQLGAMARPQRFLKTDFDREREVILEELRKNEDSPGRQLFQELFSKTFSKHPYGKPVIGTKKSLIGATVQRLERFYKEHYVSGRMGLVVVGPIGLEGGPRRKAILKILEKRFGQSVLPKRLSPRGVRPHELALRKRSNFNQMTFDVKSPSFAAAFRVPHILDRDIAALDLLSGVLASGEASRLYQSLFHDSSLVTDIGGSLYVPSDPGMLYFEFETDEVDKIQPASKKLFEGLAEIKHHVPSGEELERVLANSESERLYATQTADGMAGRLGFLRFVLGDLRFDRDYLEQLRECQPQDITRAAEKYLIPSRLSAVTMLPKNSKVDLKIMQDAAEKSLRPQTVKAAPVEEVMPEAIRSSSPNGIRYIHLERPYSHVFSIHLAALGGLRLELAPGQDASQNWGASHLMALTWAKGTSTKDARLLAKIIEGKAASLDGFSGRNTVGLQMTGLTRDWKELSRLFIEVLTDPAFSETEIQHSRRVTQDSIRSIEDHSSQLCSKLFLETLFEKHPYGKTIYGDLHTVEQINSEKLKQLHRHWFRPERISIAVSGNISGDTLQAWLGEVESALNKSGAQRVQDPKITDEQDLKAPRWVEKNLGREQIHLITGGFGLKLNDEERFALRILQNILGGQSGRLFIELREKKSLAYTVAPITFEGIERGYAATYIACSPGKKNEAVQGIQKVMEKLVQKGPTTSELSRARELIVGQRSMELQSDSSLASHHGLELLYGLPNIESAELRKRLHRVTSQQVRDVCRKYFLEQAMVTAVVG